jgi:hypothetical protein
MFRRNSIKIFILLLLMGVFLSGCGSVPAIIGMLSAPTSQVSVEPSPTSPPSDIGPETARTLALAFITAQYNLTVPSGDAEWVGGDVSTASNQLSLMYLYVYGDWETIITIPRGYNDVRVYSVKAQNQSIGFYWEGMVEQGGQVTTTLVSTPEPEVTPTVLEPHPVSTLTSTITRLSYNDDRYKLGSSYPADWNLTEIPIGAGSNTNVPARKALQLKKGDWTLVVEYKFRWEAGGLGGGLPAGEQVENGWVTILGRSVVKHLLIHENKVKAMWYGGSFEELDIYIRLDAALSNGGDYYSVDIPQSLQAEVDQIAAQIIRTGPPVEPPIPTPTPVPPTSTPIPVPCNAVNFVADITIPDGTKFAPDAEFTKTWQIRNVGSCVWNSRYDLVFVEGNRMGASKAIGLPGKVRPGERLNISIELESPGAAGKYRGYWMLRSDTGEWFGIGKSANKPFWVDIKVVETNAAYQYDFAVNYCAATWRSEDMRLPCPGYTTSGEGFAVLLEDPRLESRRENELALWVHPNEERNGWLEGTYPTIKIEDGDHFRAWVGCMEGHSKCSLKFYLDYINPNGKVRRLGEWLEAYDGLITDIDLDLSALAGKEVRFVLGVEGLTKNVNAAHGFWFLPHIQNVE